MFAPWWVSISLFLQKNFLFLFQGLSLERDMWQFLLCIVEVNLHFSYIMCLQYLQCYSNSGGLWNWSHTQLWIKHRNWNDFATVRSEFPAIYAFSISVILCCRLVALFLKCETSETYLKLWIHILFNNLFQ